MPSFAHTAPFFAALLVAHTLAAQPSGSPAAGADAAEPPVFSETIDVRVVNVEAVVTDRQGERVRGLTANDLRLLVDGLEVPIDYFAEVGGDGTPSEAGPSGGPEGGGGLGPPRGRSLLVFLDDGFAVKTHRDMVLKYLAEQLDGLQADDRVAFVSFDGNQITVLSDWTGDKGTIAAIISQARARPSKGIEIVAWRRSLQEGVEFQKLIDETLGYGGRGPAFEPRSGEGLGDSGPFETPVDPARNSRLYDRPTETFISGFGTEAIASRLSRIPLAVMAAMHAFAGAPGRKVMLLMSGGWPSASLAGPIAVEANRLGFTLYPVDVPGVDTTFPANDTGRLGSSLDAAAAGSAWESDSEYALELMARATGGQASYNGNRLQALPRALADSRSYYWLSFTPRWSGDDRSHRIEVVPRRLDLSVRARRSFTDLSLATRTQIEARGVLFFGGEEASRQLKIEAGPEEPTHGLGRRVPFHLAIPLAPFAATHLGAKSLDLLLAAQSLDSFGTRINFPETPVRIALDGAATPEGTTPFTLTLRLKRRVQKLVFTLREPASGTVIWGETKVRP